MNDRPTDAELRAAGFYDPDAPDAAERRALLDFLFEIGATLDDLVAAGPDLLPVVPTNVMMWGDDRERLTLDEMVAATGADRDLIKRVWRAAGFPDPEPGARPFTRRDVGLFAIMNAGAELLGEDVGIQLVRVLGAAAARVADAAVSAFVVNVGPRAMDEDPSGLLLARANAESMVQLDGLTFGFDVLVRHHLERAFRPLDPEAVPEIDLVRRSLGFADLVNSTAWTEQLELPELGKALNEFEATASEIVVQHGGRVVKLIGDEVMFIANLPSPAVEIALGLVDAFASHPLLPPVRAAVATGAVLARDGDYSGPVVNLAARAVKLADPSSVLVDDATRATLPDAFACDDAGRCELKGFAEPVSLYRVTRTG
jgi:class 3 adenylate cyclase